MKPPIESRVLRRIRSGDRVAVRRFWSRIEDSGAPLVERLPGESKHCLVTFLWRSRPNCDVSVLSALDTYSRDRGRLTRLPGTDIWYKTYRVRSDVRTIYHFTDVVPPKRWSSLDSVMEYYRRRMRDPLNPMDFLFPADPEDPKDRDLVGSVLSLPKARRFPKLSGVTLTGAGGVEMHRFRSRLLGNERRVWIYRPAGGSQSRATPPNLLVVFDGQAYLTMVPTPVVLDRLRSRGRIGPTYAVLIDNPNSTRSQELACNHSFAGFLVTELMPWVERQLDQTFAPRRTVLVGSSLGGLAAAHAALRYPSRFGNVLSQSGAFAWAPPDEEPGRLTREYAESRRTTVRFYLEAGILETSTHGLTREVPSILDSNRHMRDVLRAKGYRVIYREFAGGHDYLWWRDTLGPALVNLLGRGRSGSAAAQGRTK